MSAHLDKLPGYQRPGAHSCHDQAQRAIASLREAICELLPCPRAELGTRLVEARYCNGADLAGLPIGRAVADLVRDGSVVELDGVLDLGGDR